MHSITYCSYWKRGGRKERDTNKTNKKDERDWERGNAGGGVRKWVTPGERCWWRLCGPILWQEGGEGYWEIQKQKIVRWCSWVYLTLVQTQTHSNTEQLAQPCTESLSCSMSSKKKNICLGIVKLLNAQFSAEVKTFLQLLMSARVTLKIVQTLIFLIYVLQLSNFSLP